MTKKELGEWVSQQGGRFVDTKNDRRRAWLHRMFALATAADGFDVEELTPDILEALLAAAPLMLAGNADDLHCAGVDIWQAVKTQWSTDLPHWAPLE